MSLAMKYVLYYQFPIPHCIDKQVLKQYFVYIWQNIYIQQNLSTAWECLLKFRFIAFLYLVLFSVYMPLIQQSTQEYLLKCKLIGT